jgi:hypothetical protein
MTESNYNENLTHEYSAINGGRLDLYYSRIHLSSIKLTAAFPGARNDSSSYNPSSIYMPFNIHSWLPSPFIHLSLELPHRFEVLNLNAVVESSSSRAI